MINNLSDHQSKFKPTINLDAKIATMDHLAWLRRKIYKYVVSARQEVLSIDLEGELITVSDLVRGCLKNQKV